MLFTSTGKGDNRKWPSYQCLSSTGSTPLFISPASMREASHTPKLYDNPVAKKRVAWKYFGHRFPQSMPFFKS